MGCELDVGATNEVEEGCKAPKVPLEERASQLEERSRWLLKDKRSLRLRQKNIMVSFVFWFYITWLYWFISFRFIGSKTN